MNRIINILATLFCLAICANAAKLTIASASDYGSTVVGFPASNTIDGSTAWTSRWVAEVVNGEAVNLVLDLGSDKTVDQVAIAWGNGDDYTHTFEIRAMAASGTEWVKIYSGTSSGSTENFETYEVTDMSARYVRVKVFSNSIGDAQQMIKEVEIYDTSSPTAASPTTPRPTARPTAAPVTAPTTPRPTARPTAGPTAAPVAPVTPRPTAAPVAPVTPRPTARPTAAPVAPVTPRPTVAPVAPVTPRPTARPTAAPVAPVTPRPTARPTASPVSSPTSGGYNLNPNVKPSGNFDLLGWYLSIPIPDNDGYATDIMETTLAGSYSSSYFYTGTDGAMVFYTPGSGVTTSSGTKYIRTELREMLRRGQTSIGTTTQANNWAFSSIPSSSYSAFGGIDGTLTASLAVNHVTTTGTSNLKNGRIIVGQIHAKDNEPCRLYYHKLPGNSQGAVYFAHETSKSTGSAETFYNLLGSMVDAEGDVASTANPTAGIALDTIWSYSIVVVGNSLTVTISQNGTQLATKMISMSSSGYNVSSDYMYFKAGIYLQDDTCATSDYAKVSFYQLSYTHN